MQKAIIIIPTYNERGNIAKTVDEIFQHTEKIRNWNIEVLVVDDTSPDGTFEVVKTIKKKNPKIHLLLNKKKAGLGGAYLKGMDMAFNKLKADVVFEFDADLSHDPTKIANFLSKINQNYDLVIGSRYIPGGGIPEDWGLHRKFLSILGNKIIMLVLTNFSIKDWTSGFRAITKPVYKAVYKELDSEQFSGYTFQIGFLHKAIRKGFRVAEVPFLFKDRTIGKSKIGPEYIKNTLIYIMKVRIQELLKNRLFKFVIVGGVGATVQLSTLELWRLVVPFQLAFFLAIECAVLSNFILSNFCTFSDRKLKPLQYPLKFLTFNLASGGSILIQQALAFVGENTIGLVSLFTIPFVNYNIDTGLLYAVVGIFIGMFWNFFAYSKIIWKKKTKK
jgi:dolichol-phosphate mannosyltransferase